MTIVSAHRTPTRLYDYARERRGARAAGDHRRGRRRGAPARHGGRHHPAAGDRRAGQDLNALDGQDSLLSIVQMPAGVPVATVAINGAKNAGILAAQILGAGDDQTRRRVAQYKKDLETMVLGKVAAIAQD